MEIWEDEPYSPVTMTELRGNMESLFPQTKEGFVDLLPRGFRLVVMTKEIPSYFRRVRKWD